MFYCLFAQNGHNSWVGAHKSVESAASACITSNVCILFLSLCSILLITAMSQFLHGDHTSFFSSLQAKPGKTRRADTLTRDGIEAEDEWPCEGLSHCCGTVYPSLRWSIHPLPLACPCGIVVPSVAQRQWCKSAKVGVGGQRGGSFMQTRPHKTMFWKLTLYVALRIDAPAVHLQAPASNAHLLQITLNNVNK